MSRVHRAGAHADVRRARRRPKRPCRSAPAVVTGVRVHFGRREVKEREEWRARVRWDPVTTDVADRPISVELYRVQLRATDASGQPAEIDEGEPAIWRQRVSADEPLRAVFAPLARPKIWYYQARVAAGARIGGRICWGAWSEWTTPVQPVSGALPGPPPVTGLTLTFSRAESRRHGPWVAIATWNEVPWWTPPDGDPVEGAARYALQLQVRRAADGVLLNTRRVSVEARDEDADTTASHTFTHISRRREYRVRVRPIDSYGRRGAWSGWTPWSRPGPAVDAPRNVRVRNPAPQRVRVDWDEPADRDGVDRYRVEVYRGGTLVDVAHTRATHYNYHVPRADRGRSHSAVVYALDEDDNPSAAASSGSVADAETMDGAALTPGTVTADRLAVSQLSAITVDAGTLTAGVIQGLTFRTGTSGNYIAIKDADAGDRIVFASSAGRPALVAGGGEITLSGGALSFGGSHLELRGTIHLANLGGDPPAPGAGVVLYAKAGRLYYRSANGNVYGPL